MEEESRRSTGAGGISYHLISYQLNDHNPEKAEKLAPGLGRPFSGVHCKQEVLFYLRAPCLVLSHPSDFGFLISNPPRECVVLVLN